MSSVTANSGKRPWYREPLVWLLISFPLTAVIAGFYTFYLAETTKDGLVVDDYYQKGKEINKSLERDRAAMRLALKGRLQLNARAQVVTVDLTSSRQAALPETLTLRWLHATRSGFDQSQELRRERTGHYRAPFPQLAPGHWYVQLEAQDWRLQGSLRVPDSTTLDFAPAATADAPAE
jgi:hypothetical protein